MLNETAATWRFAEAIKTMNTIKNIHLLTLTEAERAKLEYGASMHQRMSNIIFKVLKVTEKAVTIRVQQGKHLSENYADQKRLVDLTKELFQKFILDKEIHPEAIEYSANPITTINSLWIKQEMTMLDIGVKDIVALTGVDKTNISAWANGTRPMSQPVKAMFYYYFTYLKLSNDARLTLSKK